MDGEEKQSRGEGQGAVVFRGEPVGPREQRRIRDFVVERPRASRVDLARSLPVDPDNQAAIYELYSRRRALSSIGKVVSGLSEFVRQAVDAALFIDPSRRPNDAGGLAAILDPPAVMGAASERVGCMAVISSHGLSDPLAARRCYVRILSIDPGDAQALSELSI